MSDSSQAVKKPFENHADSKIHRRLKQKPGLELNPDPAHGEADYVMN